ncbi:hypothetical protein D0Z07_5407 [Hyphodiscus hymeniophilus]|uniref:Serine-rich protein n=1 Tax=Hyphodiscus hymeniophilus TaxID=353542 RepID=A0A9P6VIT1_9HELO|nr:hypothetical protein D0Z07_5407 [Hyphodiscus hymeniophilus]
MSTGDSPPRKPLHERSDSLTNTRALAAVRLVPPTPPRLLGDRDDIFSRTPLPTHPSHILSPGRGKGKGRDEAHALQFEFQQPSKAPESTDSSASTSTHLPPRYESATGSPILKPRPKPKKRLHIHPDQKTFSLVPQEHPQEDTSIVSPTLSNKSSYSILSSNAHNAGLRSNSITSCTSEGTSISAVPATPALESKQPISADLITIEDSPSNHFVGGLRKVARTPDLKQKAAVEVDSPLPHLPEPDTPVGPTLSQDLSAKPSFQSESTETATTTSENTNYKLLGDPSPASSVIYRPQTDSESENDNYEILGESSPSESYTDLRPQYSQSSLVVPPLNPRGRRSSENLGLGYYKSRSRESLRSASLTSISTVLSQREAARAVVGSGSLIQLPILASRGTSSWARPLTSHPLPIPMNETPHQWSSQLSTVPSVSEGGTDRGSRTWSDDNWRRSSAFQSSQSRHSRRMLSISSSLAAEETASISRSDSLEPPQAIHARDGQIQSSSSFGIIGDQDEHGDGITDMRDLRAFPSRSRLSGFYSVSDNNTRTNTMRSTSSSRANSLLTSSIPTWARVYYGSGERRFLAPGAPGSSTEASDSRASSFRSGSPNTDNFPLSIYSPRRRPRGINPTGTPSNRGSMEITPAPQLGSDGQLIQDPYSKRFRTWSMSSIWSPHLRLDRRAIRHSVWEPPSVNWSTEGGWFGRRNIQIVMFIIGWILPFAWMIAAVLPLPRNPMNEMRERDDSNSNLSQAPNDYTRQFGPMDEARYESAKWWRNLNRWMSLVGVLIIAAVIVLVVIGLKQQW